VRALQTGLWHWEAPHPESKPGANWANKGVPPEQILDGLRPLLELSVEHVLAPPGGPTDRAALERAVS
jgi:hypothetical protein